MWPTIGVFGGALVFGILILLFAGNSEEKIRNRDAISKSAIFSHLTASLEGLISIRAFQCETRFIDLFKEKIDQNHKYTFAMMELKCWLVITYIHSYSLSSSKHHYIPPGPLISLEIKLNHSS